MLDVVFSQLRGWSKGQRDEISRRRRVSTVDPAADAMEYVLSDFDELLDRVEKDTEFLTVDEFADLHKTTPQTVRTWIRSKRIRGELTTEGYKIPRDQTPPIRRHRRAS